MQHRWLIRPSSPETDIRNIETSLKVTTLMAEMLLRRNLTDAGAIREYISPGIQLLHNPFLMKDMDRAVARLDQAIGAREKIMVFGDYDVDGTTAVALVYSMLKPYTEVSYYIPDRYEEGYGLSIRGIDRAGELGATLMIVLDCGVKAIDKVAYAKSKGIDIIVCDHHEPGESLPDCIVLDPKRADCGYPFRELCGCGVGFKLIHAWLLGTGQSEEELFDLLDLVAIAIGADIVQVTGENRILCKLGLDRLNAKPRAGIDALVKQAGKSFPLDLTNVVFTIAPRINAAGRLESGMRAVDLLLAEDECAALAIAIEIDEHNTNRRLLDAEITMEALQQLTEDPGHATRKSTVVFQPGWHKGVVGIVASRLIESHYRPTVVLTESKGVATGSARSVDNFNIHDAILECEHLLTQFGGHHHAAGLTLPLENVPAFREAFELAVRKNNINCEETPELCVDHEIRLDHLFIAGQSVEEIPRVLQLQEQLEPFGPGNMKPVFCIRSAYAASYSILKGEHLKIELFDSACGLKLSAIGFRMAHKADLVASGCAFDCAFTLEKNTWNGRTRLQLQIKDIRPAEDCV